jgi:hypothetical protein
MAAGRDPMKGRHNVGGRTANPGKIRGGQSEPASNKVKTGVPGSAPIRSMGPKPAVLTNQAETSRDVTKKISRPPMPFADPQGTVNTKASSGPRGAKPGGESVANPKGVYAGKSGSSVGQSNPGGGATGYSKLPNQRFQIGGRTSVAKSPRKSGDNGSGYPAKRNRSFYGEA